MKKIPVILISLLLVACGHSGPKPDRAPPVSSLGAPAPFMTSRSAEEHQKRRQAEAQAAFERKNAAMAKSKSDLGDIPLIQITGEPSIEKYSSLRPNMTQAQVRALLGEPNKVDDKYGPYTTFIYLQCPEICRELKLIGPNVALIIKFDFRGDGDVPTNGLSEATFTGSMIGDAGIVTSRRGTMATDRRIQTITYYVYNLQRDVIEKYEAAFAPKSRK